ncbi:MAG: alpha/beta hydrolase [Planctomycetes bacterium]|nr:alpha/beta hydrolase [Planctomycetota bacterium]
MPFLFAALLALLSACGSTSHWPETLRDERGAALRYEVDGEGEPTLVFVHGWACKREYWYETTRRFRQVRRVVALDLMGHGESDAARTEWSMEAFAGDVVRVCDALGLQKVVLVGHSMGGVVALEAARRLGPRCVAVVGVESLHDVARQLSPEEVDAFLEPFRADFTRATQEFVRTELFPKDAEPRLSDLVARDMSARPPAVALAVLEAYLRHDAAASLAAVTVPVHCINAKDGPWATNLAGNAALNPRFSAALMPGVGHFPMLEQSELFARVLADFVRPLGGG